MQSEIQVIVELKSKWMILKKFKMLIAEIKKKVEIHEFLMLFRLIKIDNSSF